MSRSLCPLLLLKRRVNPMRYRDSRPFENVARSSNSRSVYAFDVIVRTCMYGNARPRAHYAALASSRTADLTAVDVIGRSAMSAHQSHVEDQSLTAVDVTSQGVGCSVSAPIPHGSSLSYLDLAISASDQTWRLSKPRKRSCEHP